MNAQRRVLIVEDDDSIGDFLSIALTDEGYTVAVAANGWIGLTLIASFQPELILLDLGLPIIDGREFIAIHRGLPNPALIIGISAMKNARSVAEALGLADFLEKPFSLEELLDRIKHCFSSASNASRY